MLCVSTICDVCVLQHLNHLITPFTQVNHTHHTQITLDHSHHTQTFHCFTPFTQPSHTTQHSHTTHRKQPKLPFGLRMSGRSGAFSLISRHRICLSVGLRYSKALHQRCRWQRPMPPSRPFLHPASGQHRCLPSYKSRAC